MRFAAYLRCTPLANPTETHALERTLLFFGVVFCLVVLCRLLAARLTTGGVIVLRLAGPAPSGDRICCEMLHYEVLRSLDVGCGESPS